MKKTIMTVGAAASLCVALIADQPAVRGPFSFEPLIASGVAGSLPACAPIALPAGFEQVIIVQEKATCPGAKVTLDAVAGQSDLTDMNTVNETGAHVGRYLYRTHENGGGAAAISVIDMETLETKVYTAANFGIVPAWSRFDGIEWTPWGTLLAAEENGEFGRLFECTADGLDLSCVDRPALGRMSHEGIAADGDGAVYVADEDNNGSIYKFVPNNYGDLSSGVLYGLNIVDEGSDGISGTGSGEWVALVPGQNGVTTDPAVSARAAANQAGLTNFLRPEDAELIGPNLYFATTTDNRVLQIPVNTDKPFVTEFFGVNVGNVKGEGVDPNYSLRSPDNLASDNAGNLYIVEDRDSRSDIWVAGKDLDHDGVSDSVSLFGTVTTLSAEGTGIYFSRTLPGAMFVNVQHAGNGNDMTVLIQKKTAGKNK